MLSSPWIDTRATGAERVRLFCLPFAGGNSLMYRAWPAELPADIGVFAVELPGRGRRIVEKPIDAMEFLIAELKTALAPYLDRDFAFFGHSMGAGIAYEAARHIVAPDGRGARHLFVSGRRAPGTPSRRPAADTLSDTHFIQRLREMGGTPEEVLRERDLMALFLPILRADFRLNDTYAPLPGKSLACTMSIYGGRSDPEALEHELAAWRALAPAGAELRLFAGDHYYLQKDRAALLAEIARVLR